MYTTCRIFYLLFKHVSCDCGSALRFGEQSSLENDAEENDRRSSQTCIALVHIW